MPENCLNGLCSWKSFNHLCGFCAMTCRALTNDVTGILSYDVVCQSIDRTSLAEKSTRKDEKTLFWPPPISLVWLPNERETKQGRNN